MEKRVEKEKIAATSLNIALLPNEETRDRAIEISQRLGREFAVHFTLNKESLLPHITLYQAHFPLTNVESLKDKLLFLSSQIRPFEIRLGSFTVQYETFVFWDCVKQDDLQRAHQSMVDLANPLREGLVLPHLSTVTNLSPEDKQDIENFGSLLIGPRFYPHITITRLKNPEDALKVISTLAYNVDS